MSGLEMRMVTSVALAASVVLSFSTSMAQRVAADVDPVREYALAFELFQKQKFAASQERFDHALEHSRDLPSAQQENAFYYQASAALELFNSDGESLMTSFVKDFPEHPRVNMAHFRLARYYFAKRRYRAVLEMCERVTERDLEQKYLEEYYFKKGYAHFQREQYDHAKEALSHVLGGGRKYWAPAQYYTSYILYREGKNETALSGFQQLENDPLFGNAVPFYILQIHHRQGRSEQVLAYGEQMLSKDFAQKRAGEIHRLLGEAYVDLKQYPEAVSELEIGISELGGNREDRYTLAYAAYRASYLDKAITYFQQVANRADELTQLAYYHLGDCHLKLGQKMEARAAFRSASQYTFDPEITEDALFNFAKTAYELSYDPYNEAVQAFEEYIARNPNSERVDEAYTFLLGVYMATRNYESAIDAVDRIKDKTEKQKALYQRIAYLRGTELYHDLRFDRALHYFKRSDKFPIDPAITAQAIFWQAESYANLKRWKAAEEHYTLFMEVPNAIRTPEFGMAHYGLAYVYFENEQFDEAISWFRRYVDHERGDSLRVNDGFLRIADAFYLKKNNARAIEFYDKAIQLGRFDTDYAIFQIAVCYGLEGQSASKIETLKAMLENYPETDFAADAKYEIAETYFFENRAQNATHYFDQVITEHPNSHYVRKAKLNKGLLFYNQSSDDQALPLFEEVAENYPATAEAKEALIKIQKIYIERGDMPGFEQYVAEKNFPDITTGALDTSYYESAEFMYLRGSLENAMNEFGAYLQKFPHGYFALHANFYRAEAALLLKKYNVALTGFDRVLNFRKSAFTERALMAAAQIHFFQENYKDALLRFAMLEEVAEVAENLMEARAGLMRCYFLLNDFDAAHLYSDRLIRSEKVPESILGEASLISAKCALAQNDMTLAEERFKEILLQSNNKIGAEAMYNLANICYLRGDFERSQALIFEMVNIFPNYDEWITRSFLLLADNYVKQNDLFQAKLTLQNLIDNYHGSLKHEAELKLDSIISAEPALKPRMETEEWNIGFELDSLNEDAFKAEPEPGYELEMNEE